MENIDMQPRRAKAQKLREQSSPQTREAMDEASPPIKNDDEAETASSKPVDLNGFEACVICLPTYQ